MTASVDIELLQPHTDAGRDYPPGAALSLPADAAAWLIAIGTAQPVNPDAAEPNPPLEN